MKIYDLAKLVWNQKEYSEINKLQLREPIYVISDEPTTKNNELYIWYNCNFNWLGFDRDWWIELV